MSHPLPWYRQWAPDYAHAGWSHEPHHKGQVPCVDGKDFPERCPECGGGLVGQGLAWWLNFRGRGPASCHSGSQYVAWCANSHRVEMAPVDELIARAKDPAP